MGIRQSDYISRKTGKKKWEVSYRDAAGKQREKRFDTKKQAEAYWTKVQTEIADGVHTPDGDAPTLEAASEVFFQVLVDERSARGTIDNHRSNYNALVRDTLGTRKINRIAPADVQRLLDQLRRRGCSAHALGRAKMTLGAILDEQIRQGRLIANPVRAVRQRRRSRRAIIEESQERELVIPQKDEVRAFIDGATAGRRWVIVRRPGGDGGWETIHLADVPPGQSVNAALVDARRLTEDVADERTVEGYTTPPWLRPFVTTLAFSGVRIGEARGLTWQCVDLDGGYLTVDQAVDTFNDMGSVKTLAGRRTVPIGPFLVNTLRQWKEACPESKAGLVFPSRAGTPIAYRNVVQRYLEPLWIKLGQTDEKGEPRYTAHTLRHFAVSLWIDQGADAKLVSKWVGHTDVGFTLRLYTHLFETRARRRDHIAEAEADVMGEAVRAG